MVRDAIVLGTVHDSIREKCLAEGDTLTLAKAIQIGQNYETAIDSMKTIANEDARVNAVKTSRRQVMKTTHQRPQDKSKGLCGHCGYSNAHKECPAKGKACKNCQKTGHFASVCRSKVKFKKKVESKTYLVEEQAPLSSDEETYTRYINSVDLHDTVSTVRHQSGKNLWCTEVVIDSKPISAQIDTGATRCILPYDVYKSIGTEKPLVESMCRLKSYSDHQLKVAGQVILSTKHKDSVVDIEYQVVHAGKTPLLSGEASVQLGLIERVHLVDKYPEVEKTTGTLPGTYKLRIDSSVTPVVHGPRRQPRALVDKIKTRLKEMEEEGHIVRVTEPTDWVSSMVTVVKGDKVRICLDPKDLNKAIKREHYPIPTVEEVVASIPPDSKYFSVIDAKSGFLQIKLDEASSLLTTFNTPVGRYRWLRLPFGIKSAPEAFQRIMDEMLEGITGARAIMDDILVAASDEQKHDAIMKQVIQRATQYNLKLNLSKCKVKSQKVKYVGHVISANGLQPDDSKIKAVKEMPRPQTRDDVKRFLGFIQYLSKFIPNMSEVDEPLRKLLRKDIEFHWEKPQQSSFDKLKELCCTTPVLAFYDPNKDLTIQCDASSFALGGVLLQEGHPVAYTSRSLSKSEQNYAQIEKETLAVVNSCSKFHHYVFGRHVTVESDHKPLQAIFSKPLLAAPMRLQSMMLRLQQYDLTVTYKPGKDIPIGDTLSRASLPSTESDYEPETINMVDHIAIAPARYLQLQNATKKELSSLSAVILQGWPDTKAESDPSVREYWTFRDELALSDGVIYKGMKFVVPPSMRPNLLTQIHSSHMGIVKCKKRANEAMFWPSMNNQIEDIVSDCQLCNEYQVKQHSEPMLPTKTPDLPWSEIASDIFEWEGKNYLLTVDYFSKYIEVDYLPDMSSSATISALKGQISRHGIPEKLRTDNGPQFSSREFIQFCEIYGISHITSSPHYPQSNGEAERGVQTVKRLWAKCDDKCLALLDYRTTPLSSCQLSPSQLLMSRRLRNLLPINRKLLKPESPNLANVKQKLDSNKDAQKFYYDRRTSSRQLPLLEKGDPVYMAPFQGSLNDSKRWMPARVVDKQRERSYIVERRGRKYRRNRQHLRLATQAAVEPPLLPVTSHFETSPNVKTEPDVASDSHLGSDNNTSKDTAPLVEPTTSTRSGRTVRMPKFLLDYELK